MTAQLSRERLEKIASWREKFGADHNVMLPAEEAEAMARMLLAGMDSEPVAYIIQDKTDRKEGRRGDLSFESVDQYDAQDINEHELTGTPLYAAPPEQVAVPVTAATVPDGWKLVPLTPTAEMISSGITAHYEGSQSQVHDRPVPGPMECGYMAMLAASPAAPEQEV